MGQNFGFNHPLITERGLGRESMEEAQFHPCPISQSVKHSLAMASNDHFIGVYIERCLCSLMCILGETGNGAFQVALKHLRWSW